MNTYFDIVPVQKKAQEIEEIIEALKIDFDLLEVTNDQELSRCSDATKIAKDRMKEIESTRTEIVKPYNEFVREVNTIFKKRSSSLEDFEGKMKRAMTRYFERKEKEAAEKRRQEAERIEAERIEAEKRLKRQRTEESKARVEEEIKVLDLAVPMEESPSAKVYGEESRTNFKKVWTFEVKDISKLPIKYLCANEKAIRTDILGGIREIAGVEIYQKTSVAIS